MSVDAEVKVDVNVEAQIFVYLTFQVRYWL